MKNFIFKFCALSFVGFCIGLSMLAMLIYGIYTPAFICIVLAILAGVMLGISLYNDYERRD